MGSSDFSSVKRNFSGLDQQKNFDAIKDINQANQQSENTTSKQSMKRKRSTKSIVQKSVDAISKKDSKKTEELKMTIANPDVQPNEIEEAENALNKFQNDVKMDGSK